MVKKLVEYCNTAWNMDGVRHYPRWVRRVPGSTTSDQNRSCISALSVPETTISSHRPELTHNIFSLIPRFASVSYPPTQQSTPAPRFGVTVPTIPWVDRDCCTIISQRKPDKSKNYV